MSDEGDVALSSGESVSLAEVERRVALGRSGRLSLQDQLDWGETFWRGGDRAAARVVLQSAFIQQGFSPQLEQARRNLLNRVGLNAATPAAFSERPAGNTVELAIEELRGVARRFGPAIEAGLARRPYQTASAQGLHPTAVLRHAAALPSKRSVAGLVGDLFEWLRPAAWSAGVSERAMLAVDALRGADGDPDRFSVQALASAPYNVIAGAIAAQELRFFLRTADDLLNDPIGSLDLFRAAAALDSAGLGPYFGNVARIVRRSANVFELASIAEQAAGEVGAAVGQETWIVLLGRSLTGGLWEELADDLGDRGYLFALEMMLKQATRMPSAEIDQGRIMRIRDAALDNLGYDLAAIAQRALVALKPTDMLERRILGTIDASAGRIAAADQSFSACLRDSPGDAGLLEQIEANRARRYEPHALLKGFGTPQDRQLGRLQRRAAAAARAGQAPPARRPV